MQLWKTSRVDIRENRWKNLLPKAIDEAASTINNYATNEAGQPD